MSSICILCSQTKANLFQKVIAKHFGEQKEWHYLICANCELIFLEPSERLENKEEKLRYSQHQNSREDPGYRRHLLRLWHPVESRLESSESIGLDYGSGPEPTMQQLLAEKGVSLQIWDPFFANAPSFHNKSFDFVLCNEVAEHFYDPYKEFLQLDQFLKTRAYLSLGTRFYDSSIEFAS